MRNQYRKVFVKPIYLTHSQTITGKQLLKAEEILREQGFEPTRRVFGQTLGEEHTRVAVISFPNLKVGSDVAREVAIFNERGAELFELRLKEQTLQRVWDAGSLAGRAMNEVDTLRLETYRRREILRAGYAHSDILNLQLEQHLELMHAMETAEPDRLTAALEIPTDWNAIPPALGMPWIVYIMGKRRLGWGASFEKMVVPMLEAGMTANAVNAKGETPVMLACAARDHATLKALLLHGADPNAQDNDGWTALMRLSMLSTFYKSHGGGPDTVDGTCAVMAQLLIEHGADPNLKPETSSNSALMLAAGKGLVQLCQALVKAGAKIDLRDSKKRRASDVAMEGGHEPCAVYLQDLEKIDDTQVDLQLTTPEIAAAAAPRRARL